MILWLVLALMTGMAIFAVLVPLARRRTGPSGSDLAVYRDQLDEIERDQSAGLIPGREADAARTEVSRRLIAAADATPHPLASSLGRRRAVAAGALSIIPVVALSLYLGLGSPLQPGAPLSARRDGPPERQSIESMVAQVEAHLERNPDDGRGWEVLAPVYLRTGRLDDAVRARGNALRLLGATPVREADFGEALTAAANGVVTADAKAAFERAAAADADEVKAQFFLGLAAEQDGHSADAEKIWRSLLARAPADASWRAVVEQSLARLAPSAAGPGPDAEQIEAAATLPPEERRDMIAGMVERLAARLKDDGSDFEGWLRLVRAYMVMGDKDKARAAASDARRALGADSDKQRRLDDLVKTLGLEG
jgi:cytochrome c-type biogenesis protein CcmH